MALPAIQNLSTLNFQRISPDHPVFKARVNAGAGEPLYVVLKGESREDKGISGSPQRVAYQQQIGTTNSIKVKRSFELMADIYQYVAHDVGEFRILTKTEVATIHFPPDYHPGPEMMWYLMEAFEHLQDMGILIKNAQVEPRYRFPQQQIRTFFNNNPALFETLGRICVVDLFVGNEDRFGKRNNKWRVINWDNIFFTFNLGVVSSRQKSKIIGIDFYDKNSCFSSFNVPIEVQRNYSRMQGYPDWPGLILGKGSFIERDQLAQDIIDFLNMPGNGGLSLTKSHVDKFKSGMHTGRRKLRDWYKSHPEQVREFVGLSSRFDLINVKNWSMF